MSKKIAYFLAFCMVSMGLLIMVPSTSGEQIAVNVRTHHREGEWPSYSYPPDDYFREEYDFSSVPDEYDNVYFSFLATDDGSPFVGNLWVFIYDPSLATEYTQMVTLSAPDDGVYNSWEDGYHWEIDTIDDPGQYTMEISNGTDVIGTHTFWIYLPSVWTATVELFEDSARTIPTTDFPLNNRVYYSVYIEDEHGGPLYYQYEYESAYSYAIQNGNEMYLGSLSLDYYGYDTDNFYLYDTSFQEGDWIVEIRYRDTDPTDAIPNTTPFTIYEPIYTATIKTFTEGYTIETTIYPMNSRIYWTAHIEDQHGRALSAGTDIYARLEHDDDYPWGYWDGDANDQGNVSDSFWLDSTYWDDEEQIGLFTLRLGDTSGGDPFTGSAEFEVIGVKITPDRDPARYAQGEEITMTITSTIFQSNINITIKDEDGSVIISWEDQSMANKIWTQMYVIDNSLPDGQYYLFINESDTDRSLGIIEFGVKKYTLQISTDAGAYLPHETITVYYTVTSNRDGSGVAGTSIEYIFRYYDTEDDEWVTLKSQPFTAGSSGSFQIQIPEDAFIDYNAMLHVWANDTEDHFYYIPKNINLGSIEVTVYTGDNQYLPGDFVVVAIDANIIEGFSRYPLKQGTVALNVTKDGVVIADYTVSGLTTDLQGELTYIFTLLSNAVTGEYDVNVLVSKENDFDTDRDTFEVVESREMSVELGFDNKYFSNWDYPEYYPGDTVTVTYNAIRGMEVVENVNCEYWVYYGSDYIAAGTSSSGEFTFDIPSDFDGKLTVNVEVTDSDGVKAYAMGYIDVVRARLLLKPNTNVYLPGDTIKVDYSVVGSDIPDASYYYEIKDDNGNVVQRGTLEDSSGKFEFTVPEGSIPDYYGIMGYITDANGLTVATSDITVNRLQGFLITFTLDKNTYRPGETATLNYEIISLDGSELPDKFTLSYGFYGGEGRSIQTSNAKGSLKLKVPDDVADGEGFFSLSSPDLEATSQLQEANIRSNPNPLAETVGDVSFLDLLLLILIVICLIIALTSWSRGKKAMEEAKLPPWKKERPLPEPDKFKESDTPSESPLEETPSDMPTPPPDDFGPKPPEPPSDIGNL